MSHGNNLLAEGNWACDVQRVSSPEEHVQRMLKTNQKQKTTTGNTITRGGAESGIEKTSRALPDENTEAGVRWVLNELGVSSSPDSNNCLVARFRSQVDVVFVCDDQISPGTFLHLCKYRCLITHCPIKLRNSPCPHENHPNCPHGTPISDKRRREPSVCARWTPSCALSSSGPGRSSCDTPGLVDHSCHIGFQVCVLPRFGWSASDVACSTLGALNSPVPRRCS